MPFGQPLRDPSSATSPWNIRSTPPWLVRAAARPGALFGGSPSLRPGRVASVPAPALCGLAQTWTALIFSPPTGGISGAPLLPPFFALLGVLFPPQQRARVGG